MERKQHLPMRVLGGYSFFLSDSNTCNKVRSRSNGDTGALAPRLNYYRRIDILETPGVQPMMI